MDDHELIQQFFDRYLERREIVYRLPLSVPIDEFWPLELAYRRDHAVDLPLRTEDGSAFWYVPTSKLISSGNELANLARYSDTDLLPQYEHDTSIMDEAYYSSAIEGAYSTKEQARELIRSGKTPETKDERMILNNYAALHFVLDHLDATINDALILEISRILTDGTLDHKPVPGWRNAGVQVMSGRQEVIYVAPSADKVPAMMEDLLLYLNDNSIHPVIKACVAHIYFVTVHPLFDGNGRTARALSYMILLQAGYDFFRQVPISEILSQEQSKYYKAIRAAQNKENGNDFTYFLEYYTDMLNRSLQDIHLHMKQKMQLESLRKLSESLASSERLCNGMSWIWEKDVLSVTSEKWKDKFHVSFETARKDLIWLAKNGYLVERTTGHRKSYEPVKN